MNRTLGKGQLLSFLLVALFLSGFQALGQPRVHHMYISGGTAGTNATTKIVTNFTAMKRNQTLRVYYTFAGGTGVEGASTYQWYTYDDNNGTNKVAIGGATLVTLTLGAAQTGKHISCEVRPRDSGGTFGAVTEYRPWDAANSNPVYDLTVTCFKPNGVGVPTPGNNILSPTGICSPRSLTWQVLYTGIDYRIGFAPKIIINWGDGVNETLDPGLFNSGTSTMDLGPFNQLASRADTLNLTNMLNQNWRVEQLHTYNYATSTPSATPNERCTYTMATTWGVGVSSCLPQGVQQQKFTVWDNESNTNLGQVDMNHDATSAGVEAGEVTNICQGDDSAIRVVDASDFNCTPGGAAIENVNPNNQARWVQFVYGTAGSNVATGGGATQKIYIGVTPYTLADLPVYGPVQYLQATVTNPASTSLDMKMPTSDVSGQTFVITMRTWNTCAPFDNNVLDGGLNPSQALINQKFNIYAGVPPASVIGSLGAPPFYANAVPTTRVYNINVITKPTTPVSNDKDFCSGTALTTAGGGCPATCANCFELTSASIPASNKVFWYYGDPRSGGAAVTNTTYGNNCRFFRPTDLPGANPMKTPALAGTVGVYSLWATYQTANGCVSDPVEAKLTIKPALVAPAAPTGAAAVCNGTLNVAYTQAGAAASTSIPASTITNTTGIVTFPTQYLWSTTFPAGVSLSATTGTNITVNYAIVTEPNPSQSGNINTALQYSSGAACTTGNGTLAAIDYGLTVGGSVTPTPKSICDGANTGTLTLAGHKGTILKWQRIVGAALPVDIANTTTTYNEIPASGPGTYQYYAVIRNNTLTGPCAVQNSTPAVITVNAVPAQPTITLGAGSTGGFTICQDGVQKIVLQASNVGGTATRFDFYQGATLVQSGAGSTYTVSTTIQSGSYTVINFGPTLCQSPASPAKPATVNPLPTAANPSGGGPVCAGSPAPDISWLLTGTPPYNLTYTTSFDGPHNFPAYATNTFTISAPTAAGTYQITSLTDANGCVATSMGIAATVTISATAPPAVSTLVAGTAVCDVGAGTVPPSIAVTVTPASIQNYDVFYKIGATIQPLINVNTTAGGVFTISPTYAQLGSTPGTYVVQITSIRNTGTGCAGSVLGPPANVIVNPKPAAPAGPVGATACSSAATGALIKVNDPGGSATIQWFSNVGGTIAALGVTGGTHGETFTPTSNATFTYYAYTFSATGPTFCQSNAGTAVVHTQDLLPAAADGGLDQLTLCGTTATMNAAAPTNGGIGTWTKTGTGTITTPGSRTTTVTGLTQSAPGGPPVSITMHWTVVSALGVCSSSSDDVTLTVNALPTIVDPAPHFCEDVAGGGSHAGVNLTTFNAAVTSGTTVTWFKDALHTVPIVPATTLQTINNTTAKTFYFHTTSAIPCGNDGLITFTVDPQPTATVPTLASRTFCEDVQGSGSHASVNLIALYNPQINATATITWYPTLADAQALTNQIAPAAAANFTVSAGLSLVARVVGANTCVNFATVPFVVNPLPQDNLITGNAIDCSSLTAVKIYQVSAALNAFGLSHSYNWNVNGAGTNFEVFNGVGFVTSNNYTVTNTSFLILLRFPNSGTFTFNVSETIDGCTGNAVSKVVNISGAPAPLTFSAAPTDLCKGSLGIDYKLTGGAHAGSNYTWTVVGGTVVGPSSGAIAQITVNWGALTVPQPSVSVTEANASGCAGAPVSVNVFLYDIPVMTSLTNATICSGAAPSSQLTFTALLGGAPPVTPITFNWKAVSVPPNVTGVATNQTGSGNIGLALTNVSGVSGIVTFEVTPVENDNPNPPNCTTTPQTVFITVLPQPVVASGQTKTICGGQAVNYKILLNPAGLPATTKFSWPAPAMSDASAQGSASIAGGVLQSNATHINDVLVNNSSLPIFATYSITALDGTCTGPPVDVVIQVNPLPVGTPTTRAEQCSNVPFSVSADNITNGLGGASSTYTWVRNALPVGLTQVTAGTSGGTIAETLRNLTGGQLSAVYVVTPTTAAPASCAGGTYTVTVPINPEPVGVTGAAPAICSDANVNYNLQTQNINVLGNGVASTFSWIAASNSNVGGESTTAQSGATINDVLTNITNGDQVVIYAVIPTSSAKSCAGAPFALSVTVHPKPVGVNDNATAICSDAAVGYGLQVQNINGLGNGVNSNFSWAAVANANVGGENTTPQTAATINDVLTNVTGIDQTVVYNVTPTSAASNCVGAAFTVSVAVHPKPVGVTTSAPAICSDNAVGYNLQTQNINTLGNSVLSSFSWIATNNANVGGESTSAQSSGLISDVLTNVTSSDQTVIYTVTPTGTTNTCVGSPFTVSVLVHPRPVGVNASATPICSNGTVNYDLQAQNITTLGNGVASTFSWIATANGNVGGESLSAQASATITDVLINITNTDQTVVYTVTPRSTANNCVGAAFTVSIVVHPKPVGVNASAPDVCSNVAMAYNLQIQNINTLGNAVNSTFSWSAASNLNVGGESVAPQSGNIITDILTNVTSADQNVVYTVIPTSLADLCLGASFTVSVAVHPKPVGVNAAANPICSNAAVGYNLQTQNVDALGNAVNSTFTWIATANANVGGESTTSQSGATLTDVLVNVTNSDQTVNYTVTPTSTANTCAGSPFSISVLVHPRPVGANASAAPICSNASVNYDLQVQNINTLGNALATNFSWVATANGNVGGESTSAQTISTINDVLTNVTNVDQTVVYTVTPTSTLNACLGSTFTVSVVVHAKPVGANDTATPICSDATVGYDLQVKNITGLGNGVPSTFSWVATSNPDVTGESTSAQSSATINDALVNVTNLDKIVQYTVVPTSTTNSCVGSSFTVQVTVHPKPVGAIANAPAICSDAAVAYNLQTQNINFVGNSVISNFSWIATANGNVSGESTGAQAGNTITDVLVNVTNADQSVVYTVTPTSSANACLGASFTVTVMVHPKPVGVTTSAPAICSNAIVNYNLQTQNINTLGNALASNFSWVAAPNGSVSGESSSPQTGNLLTDALINVTSFDQTVTYTVTPTSTSDNCLGGNFFVSVVVHPAPIGGVAIAPPICSDLPVGYNLQTQNIDVLGNAVASTFVWVAASNAFVGGESTSSKSGSIITDNLVNVTTSDQTVIYTVTPTSSASLCVGVQFTVSVTVHPKPVGVNSTAPPICSDANVNYDIQSQNINTLGNNINSNFSWMAAANANVSGESTTAQSGALINDNLTNITNSDQTVIYTVLPTSTADNCAGAPSFTVSVTVHPKPVGVTGSAPAICSDAMVNYNLQTQNVNTLGNNLAANFSWVATPNGNVSGESTSAQAGNLITDALVNVTSLDQTVMYTISATGIPDGCPGDVFTISVLVHPKPVGVLAPIPPICSDASVAYDLQVQNINALGNGVTSTFSWVAASNGSVGGESTTAKTGSIINDILTNVTNLDQTVTYTVTPTSQANLCLGAQFNVSVLVHPKPVGVSTAAPAICSKASVNYDLQTSNINALGNNLASTFSWAAVSNSSVSGESTVAQSGALITDVLVNVTNSNQIVTYNVTPTGPNSCVGTAFVISVTVKPEPVGVADTKNICSDEGVAYNLQTQNIDALGNAMASSSFSWIVLVNNPNVTGESLTAQNTTSITDVLNNITSGNEVVTYTVTPTGSNGCVGNNFTVAVTVRPEPVLNVVPVPACSGLATNLTLSTTASSGPIQSYNIISRIIDGGLTASGGNAPVPANGQLANYLANDKFTNFLSGVPALHVTYRVEPVSTGGCKGDAMDLVVTILPEPVVAVNLNNELCSGLPYGKNLSTNGVSVAASNFDITAVVDAGLTGAPTVGLGLLPNAIFNDTFINQTATPLNVTYTVTPHGTDGCVGASKQIVFKIDPVPVLFNPGFPAVCSSNLTNSNPVNVVLGTNGTSVNAASYLLVDEQYSTDGGTTFLPALPANFNPFGGSNASIGTSSDINLVKNDMFNNTRSGSVIVRYTIQPKSPFNCVGANLDYKITVNPEPIMTPATAATCSGSVTGIVLSAAVGSAPITGYTLQSIFIADARMTPSGTNAGLGGHAAANFLAADVFTNTSNIVLHVIYTIVPVAGSCSGDPQTVDLSVNPAPAVSSTLNKTVCTGEASGITLAKDPTSVNVASFNILGVSFPGLSQTAGNTGVRMGVTASEIVNDVFTNPTAAPLTVTYTVQAVSAFPCTGPTKAVVLTVEPTITVTTTNSAPDICSGSATNINLKSSTAPTAGNITFDVVVPTVAFVTGYVDRSNVANTPVTGFTIADVLVNSDNVPHTVVYQITPNASGAKGGLGCSGNMVPVSVIVEPRPRLVASAISQTVCEGTPTSITLTTPTYPPTGSPAVGTMKFELVAISNPGGVTGVSPLNTQFSVGAVLADVLSNPTLTGQVVTYTLQPKIVGGAGCVGANVDIVITVNPLPDLNVPPPTVVCSQDPFSISLTSAYSNVINQWPTPVVISGTATGFSGGAGDLIFQSIKNTGSVPAIIRYIVTPKLNGCSGTPLTIDVTVNPIADFAAPPPTQNVCFNSTLNVPLTSNVAGTTFSWTVDPNSSGVPLTGSGPVINQLLATPAGDFLTYHITATGPGATACASQERVMTVVAAPQMNVSFLNPPSNDLCLGSKDFLQISLEGQAPFTFTYSVTTSAGTSLIPVPPTGNFKSISITPTDTTVYKIESLKDAYGCAYPGPFPSVRYRVGSTNSNLTVVGLTSGCSPFEVTFKYDRQAYTDYIFRWRDGSADSTPVHSTVTTNGVTFKHTFTNPSPSGVFSPKIRLDASLPWGCSTFSEKQITVNPTIITNIFPDKTEICSGETVIFTNQSFGVATNGNSWTVKDGSGAVVSTSTDKSPHIQFTNNTATNPEVFDVIYQANSTFNCPAPPVTTQITVYRGVTASISNISSTEYVGGSATWVFGNTSTVHDNAQFRYDWDFGSESTSTPTPSDNIGAAPDFRFNVVYTSPGARDVTLTVTNRAAELAGLACSSTFTLPIDVLLPPLVVGFTADPGVSCYPSRINVTSNTSTGDIFDWKLVDSNGKTAATSNAPLPSFDINIPGEYILYLTTRSSLTPQQETTHQTFLIYDKPLASFDVRPDVVYVPDTEMNTFNFSFGATDYIWDFGDNGTSTEYQPVYTYKIEGSYTVTLIAQNNHGPDGNGVDVVCADTLTRTVLAKQGGLAKVPNAFTPNTNGPNDGTATNGSFNDVFLPIVKGVEDFNMQIYDRWGNLIFESNSATTGWNGYYNNSGHLMPSGVYVFKLTVRLSDNQRSTQIGDVTMIR